MYGRSTGQIEIRGLRDRAARAAGVELSLEIVARQGEEHVPVLLRQLLPIRDQSLTAHKGCVQLTHLAMFPRVEAAAAHVTCKPGYALGRGRINALIS